MSVKRCKLKKSLVCLFRFSKLTVHDEKRNNSFIRLDLVCIYLAVEKKMLMLVRFCVRVRVRVRVLLGL